MKQLSEGKGQKTGLHRGLYPNSGAGGKAALQWPQTSFVKDFLTESTAFGIYRILNFNSVFSAYKKGYV